MSGEFTDYEVWRSGPNPNGRDVRVYFGLDEQGAQNSLDLCNKDKAEAYPDAPIEFYIMRVTRSRVTLAADREPDVLRAKVEGLRDRWRSEASDPDGHSLLVQVYSQHAQALDALLAHPATDQEADRG